MHGLLSYPSMTLGVWIVELLIKICVTWLVELSINVYGCIGCVIYKGFGHIDC